MGTTGKTRCLLQEFQLKTLAIIVGCFFFGFAYLYFFYQLSSMSSNSIPKAYYKNCSINCSLIFTEHHWINSLPLKFSSSFPSIPKNVFLWDKMDLCYIHTNIKVNSESSYSWNKWTKLTIKLPPLLSNPPSSHFLP